MIYEIINPSDPVTIEADDLLVAQVATLLIGSGNMGLRDECDEAVLPIFLFGGLDEWLASKGLGGEDGLNGYIESHRAELSACLLSAACCKLGVRRALLKAMAGAPDPQESIRAYNEEQRSSLNDICGFAHELGADLVRVEDRP